VATILLAALPNLAGAPPAGAQEAAPELVRAFTAGDVQRYRVTLTVRSVVDGHRPVRVGLQTLAEPFADAAEASLSWEVTRRLLAVDADGSAHVEEALNDFSPLPSASGAQGQPSPQQALIAALAAWTQQLHAPMLYRESPAGQLQGLGETAAPVLDDAPPVLTLWLRRALRPTAALPARLPREGDRWTEPRSVRLPPWSSVQGTETGAWLEGPRPELSIVKLINLHVTQQISGEVPATTAETNSALGPGQARFHAESLNTLVHLGAPLYGGYGSLFAATRSASREVSRAIEGVPGFTEPPVFRALLSVTVRIENTEALAK
jgi:hypothetical protein